MADTLRIVTCNIRNGRAFDGMDSWPFRWRRLVDYLCSLDADVLALQEAYTFQIRTISRGLDGHQVIGDGRNVHLSRSCSSPKSGGYKTMRFCQHCIRINRLEHGEFYQGDVLPR